MSLEAQKSPEQLAAKLTEEQLAELGFMDKMKYFWGQKEYLAMISAAIKDFTDLFGEEKEEPKKPEEELDNLQDEVESTKTERSKLDNVRADVTEQEEIEAYDYDLDDKVEVASGSHVAFFGDSILKGVLNKYKADERPGYVGGVGFPSDRTLRYLKLGKMLLAGDREKVEEKIKKDEVTRFMKSKLRKEIKQEHKGKSKAERQAIFDAQWPAYKEAHFDKGKAEFINKIQQQAESVKGKKEAVIYIGGNNLSYTPLPDIVNHMVKMTEHGREMGVAQFVICTRFPPDPQMLERLERKIATEPDPEKQKQLRAKFDHKRNKARKLNELIREAYAAGRFGESNNSKLVDLYQAFVNPETGYMKDKFRKPLKDPDKGDVGHPYQIYGQAANLIDQAFA